MHPAHGQHLLLCNRSAVLLQLGRKQEALEDALQCLDLSPPGFVKVWGVGRMQDRFTHHILSLKVWEGGWP